MLKYWVMNSRCLLAGVAVALLAMGSATAQEASDSQRRTQRRALDTTGAYMGGGMVVESSPLLSRRPQPVTTQTEIAPMPNNGIEAPRGFQQAQAPRLTPGMIAPALPGRGAAQETGSPGSLQDRLFRPAPGAHLRIPMSW